MRGIRKALTIVGGATLMSLMLGLAAFAFSAAVQPALLTNPVAIMVGFAGTADAQPVALGPIVTNVPAADPAAAALTRSVPAARDAAGTRRPSAISRVSSKAKRPRPQSPGAKKDPGSSVGSSDSDTEPPASDDPEATNEEADQPTESAYDDVDDDDESDSHDDAEDSHDDDHGEDEHSGHASDRHEDDDSEH